jgi:NADH:ubiquinone oxidoreductase subunit H
LQPLLDALKLFCKQNITPFQANKFIYRASPHMALFLALFVWLCLPMVYLAFRVNYSLLMFFCLRSLLVFPVLLSGWSSNSKYSLIGRLRSVAQSISYESVFSTLVVLLLLVVSSFSIRSFIFSSSPFLLFLLLPWLICTLAETHRAPFDFRESESELVRGFNTEYGGAYFSFIFLAEYGMLLFSCFVIPILFFSFAISFSVVSLSVLCLIISFLFIWVRVTFCRFRYDILIMVSWKVLLPLSLNLFILYLFIFC